MQFSRRELRVFITDCEGPISKNDNAFEIASHFLPRGSYLFSLISKYDDVLADFIKPARYRAGYTLTLITPFLKAHGVTNEKVEEYSRKNLILLHGAEEMLRRVREAIPSFIVSTSYDKYMTTLCTLIGFPYENVYCTKLDLDKYTASKEEIDRLRYLEGEILTLPPIEIPPEARSISQFSKRSQETVRRLDSIFLEEISRMTVGKMLKEIKPVGGEEKANAVRAIITRVGCNLSGVVYFGDSITDVQAFQLVREGGGLTISFNGNEYAVRNAEVAVLSESTFITSVLTNVFSKSGREGILKLVENWGEDALRKCCSDEEFTRVISDRYHGVLKKVELVTKDNVDRLIEESSGFRKTVRGEAIGKLG